MKHTTVAISGGFDPIHAGHIRLIQEAKKLGTRLIIILNNDNWLIAKKGHYFMKQSDRKLIVENIKGVDEVILTKHKKNPQDMTVTSSLKALRPDVFANGGDRTEDTTPENKICNLLGIKQIFNVGGKKIRSSSSICKDYQDKVAQ